MYLSATHNIREPALVAGALGMPTANTLTLKTKKMRSRLHALQLIAQKLRYYAAFLLVTTYSCYYPLRKTESTC